MFWEQDTNSFPGKQSDQKQVQSKTKIHNKQRLYNKKREGDKKKHNPKHKYQNRTQSSKSGNNFIHHECSDIEGEYHLTQEGSTSKHILKRLGKDATLTLTYQKYEGDTKIDDLYFYQADGKYYYKENGGEAIEETQSVWQAAVKEYFFMCMPLEEKGDKAVLLGGSAFENNLETVKQKGFNVTAIAKEGSDVYSMTYNVQTSLLSDYTVTFADGTIKKYIVELNIDDFKG